MKNVKSKLLASVMASSMILTIPAVSPMAMAQPLTGESQDAEDATDQDQGHTGEGGSEHHGDAEGAGDSSSDDSNSDSSAETKSISELVNTAKKNFENKNKEITPKPFKKDSPDYSYFEGLYIISELSDYVESGKDKDDVIKGHLKTLVDSFPKVGKEVTTPKGFDKVDRLLDTIKKALEKNNKPRKGLVREDSIIKLIKAVATAKNEGDETKDILSKDKVEPIKKAIDKVLENKEDTPETPGSDEESPKPPEDKKDDESDSPSKDGDTKNDSDSPKVEKKLKPGLKIIPGDPTEAIKEGKIPQECVMEVTDPRAYEEEKPKDSKPKDEDSKPKDEDANTDDTKPKDEGTTKPKEDTKPKGEGEGPKDGHTDAEDDQGKDGAGSEDKDEDHGTGDEVVTPKAEAMSLKIVRVLKATIGDKSKSSEEGSGDESDHSSESDDNDGDSQSDNAPGKDETETPDKGKDKDNEDKTGDNKDKDKEDKEDKDKEDTESSSEFILDVKCISDFLKENGKDLNIPNDPLDPINGINIPDLTGNGGSHGNNSSNSNPDDYYDAPYAPGVVIHSVEDIEPNKNSSTSKTPKYSPSGHKVLGEKEASPNGYWDGSTYHPSEEFLSGGKSSEYIVGEKDKKDKKDGKSGPKVDTGGAVEFSLFSRIKDFFS